MPPRFICPHCHAPVDPLALEEADCAGLPCRICPECDDLIVVSDGCSALADKLPKPLAEISTPVSVSEEAIP